MAASARPGRLAPRRLAVNGLRQIALLVVGGAFLVPLLWMVVTSLKSPSQVFTWPPVLIPSPARWHNYADALLGAGFLRFLINTIALSAVVAAGNVVSSTLAAYGLSQLQWRGRELAFTVILSTLLLPDFVTIIPLFVLCRRMGLVGGYAGFVPLILPFWLGRAYFIFLMRQFMLRIPAELADAARIDGCGELRILLSIMLPLCVPALLSVVLYSLVATWSDFLGPLVYLRDERFYTVSVGLVRFQSHYVTQWDQLMAAAAATTMPVVAVFLVTQRFFVQGLATTGLK